MGPNSGIRLPGTIKLRGKTAAAWAAANPVLAVNEPGFETDTRILKIGDGVTAWNDLPCLAGSRTVVASNLSWSGDSYLYINVPTRAFGFQPNYIIKGYCTYRNYINAFVCETCKMLTDGDIHTMSGIINTESTSFKLQACTNLIDPYDANNPYYGLDAYNQLQIIPKNMPADMGSVGALVINEVIEEIL